MAYVEWDDLYSVRVEEIDRQHKKIFDYINQLHTAMKSGADMSEIEKILNSLVDYTATHFAEEEAKLARSKYPDLDAHKKLHVNLVNEVIGYAEKVKSGELSVSVKLMKFLTEWLQNHILKVDKGYTQFLLDAGEQETTRKDTTTTSRTSSIRSHKRSVFSVAGIQGKMILAFFAMAFMIAVVGAVGYSSNTYISTIVNDELTEVWDASDIVMESMIDVGSYMWVVSANTRQYSEEAQVDGKETSDKNAKNFQESMAKLRIKGIIPAKYIDSAKTDFETTRKLEAKLLGLAIGKYEAMSEADLAAVNLKSVAQKNGHDLSDILLIENYIMAVNDYAAYADSEIKLEFERYGDRLRKVFPANSNVSSSFGKLVSKADRLVAVTEEYITTEKEFGKIGRRLVDKLSELEKGGDGITGTNELTEQILKNLHDTIISSTSLLVGVTLLGLVFGFTLAIIMSNRLVSPIRNAVSAIQNIAEGEGDLTARITVASEDEIGEMAEWTNIFIEKTQDIIKNIAQSSGALANTAKELDGSSAMLAVTADQMRVDSSGASGAIEESKNNISDIAESADSMSTSVSAVAAAMEEMSASINEVSQSTLKGLGIAQNANERATSANSAILRLSESSVEINKVLDTIKGFADQTKLLALNATIEAAAAGEAGRGFAVVADEVRDLARQTNAATEDISDQIAVMQSTITDTITSIKSISEVISDMNEISHIISSTVEEQSATINEIASNSATSSHLADDIAEKIKHVSDASVDISKNITEIDKASRKTAMNASQSNAGAMELSQHAQRLNKVVTRFKY